MSVMTREYLLCKNFIKRVILHPNLKNGINKGQTIKKKDTSHPQSAITIKVADRYRGRLGGRQCCFGSSSVSVSVLMSVSLRQPVVVAVAVPIVVVVVVIVSTGGGGAYENQKLSQKKQEKKYWAHLAACTSVPHPFRRCSLPLGHSRPFGTASAPVRIKE
jgi:hypothetical protein